MRCPLKLQTSPWISWSRATNEVYHCLTLNSNYYTYLLIWYHTLPLGMRVMYREGASYPHNSGSVWYELGVRVQC